MYIYSININIGTLLLEKLNDDQIYLMNNNKILIATTTTFIEK